MSVTASQIFDFLDRHRSFNRVVYKVTSTHFSILRMNLRKIILTLNDEDANAKDTADSLRARLSECLTAPVLFDTKTLEFLAILGEPNAVEAQWGRDIRTAYEAACTSAEALKREESPVRSLVREIIEELMHGHLSFRIFCHRSNRAIYQSIVSSVSGQPPPELPFIHSPKEYRETDLFDTLIKVGPLRSRGWGGVPDALLTAPRFKTLIQIVWSGCFDEPGFGLDPVIGTGITEKSETATALPQRRPPISLGTWTITEKRFGQDRKETDELLIDKDDLQIFREIAESRNQRASLLIQIGEEHGVLYPVHSQALSYDPNAVTEDQIAHRRCQEMLTTGMYIVFPLLGQFDHGVFQARDGKFSKVWKHRLSEEFQKDPDGLCRRLRAKGIDLLGLRFCIENWCKPLTTVIPGPQKISHFRILIEELGIDFEEQDRRSRGRFPWWQYAWQEIRSSRGEAIQTGLNEQEIIQEHVIATLNDLRLSVQEKCTKEDIFTLEVPEGKVLQGYFLFAKVSAIEDGFLAPEGALRIISELKELEAWRA